MIDKKWKWVAKDKNGAVYVFTQRPKIEVGRISWTTPGEGGYEPSGPIFILDDDWKESLHEIIHHEDGKIEFRKVRPELKVDDPVLVKLRRSTQWSRRHFACWDEKNGLIRCWDEGRTSFTSEGINSVWDDYKLP